MLLKYLKKRKLCKFANFSSLLFFLPQYIVLIICHLVVVNVCCSNSFVVEYSSKVKRFAKDSKGEHRLIKACRDKTQFGVVCMHAKERFCRCGVHACKGKIWPF